MRRTTLPQSRKTQRDKITARMTQSFGAPVNLNLSLCDTSLRGEVPERGPRVRPCDAGEAIGFDELAVRAGVADNRRVMRDQGMLVAKGITRVGAPSL